MSTSNGDLRRAIRALIGADKELVADLNYADLEAYACLALAFARQTAASKGMTTSAFLIHMHDGLSLT